MGGRLGRACVGVGLHVWQVYVGEYWLIDFRLLQFWFLRECTQCLHLVHWTERELWCKLTLQMLHGYLSPGVGPGLISIPARNSSIRTSVAGRGWSLVKKVGRHLKKLDFLLPW